MTQQIPPRVGVMILPGMSFFPGALLPLYIFEPRYREMLSASLAGERMFAVAQADEEGSACAVASLGVVRACVANPDGTSNLILQGTCRVTISRLRMKPYPTAAAEVLRDVDPDPELSEKLREDVERAFQEVCRAGVEVPKGFENYLAQISAHGEYADAIASAFVHDPVERRGLLEETSVPTRLARLLRCLMRQLPRV